MRRRKQRRRLVPSDIEDRGCGPGGGIVSRNPYLHLSPSMERAISLPTALTTPPALPVFPKSILARGRAQHHQLYRNSPTQTAFVAFNAIWNIPHGTGNRKLTKTFFFCAKIIFLGRRIILTTIPRTGSWKY